MHDPLIRGLASNGKVKSAATRGPGFPWLGSAPQAGAFSGFQYLTPPERRLDTTRIYREAYEQAGTADGLLSEAEADREAAAEFDDDHSTGAI
jgi:hypothetical protein